MLNGWLYQQKDFKVFCDNQKWSSELGSSPDKTAPWPLGYSPGGQSFFTDTPSTRHSCHLSNVIGEDCTRPLPLTLRVLDSLSRLRIDVTMPPQGNKSRLSRTCVLQDGQRGRGKIDIQSLQLGDWGASDLHGYQGSRRAKTTSNPDNGRGVAVSKDRQTRKQGYLFKMLCTKCHEKEAYWSASWCSDCIWEFIKE